MAVVLGFGRSLERVFFGWGLRLFWTQVGRLLRCLRRTRANDVDVVIIKKQVTKVSWRLELDWVGLLAFGCGLSRLFD